MNKHEATEWARGPSLREAAQPAQEPTRSQNLAAAGFMPRDNRLQCDECGGKFTRQMLPIHKCEPAQEPVATITECEACFTPDVCQLRGTCDYYAASQMRIAAPPQRKPLSEEEIDDMYRTHNETPGLNFAGFARRFARAVEAGTRHQGEP